MRDWLKVAANVAPLLPEGFRLDALLPDGGQGVVYRGTANGSQAAIKFYIPGQAEKRIEREVEALAQLDCPSIVRLLWHRTVQIHDLDLHVVATEFVEGEPLKEALASRQPLSRHKLGVLAFDVAQAIAAMWSKRIVHRDLKPANVLLRTNGRACVIDLGLARHLNESSLTAANTTWGTRGYFSPEQSRFARALTCHSDVFALGILIVEAACGHHPSGYNQERLFAMQLHQAAIPALASWPHADLTRQMLDPRPNCRPAPGGILEALKEYSP